MATNVKDNMVSAGWSSIQSASSGVSLGKDLDNTVSSLSEHGWNMYEKPYPPRNPQDRPVMRITPKSGITLNGPARSLFTTPSVLLFFNQSAGKIGFLPVPEGTPHSYRVRNGLDKATGKPKGTASIDAAKALTSYGISQESVVGSYEPETEGNLITIQLRLAQDF